MDDDLKEIFREILANYFVWEGTCGNCHNSCSWSPKYGSMLNMKRTYCLALGCPDAFYGKNLIMKNSTPKWCPRKLELKDLEDFNRKEKTK